jgi:2-polyprenyl-3-methyl-5-hydroxy-6-metoxy-1,4-benzoquinol methylase
MEKILKADDIKPDFEGLKEKWTELLSKYFIDSNNLNPKYTKQIPCPHCQKNQVEKEFVLNGFCHKTCSNCKTTFVSPRLNDSCIEELYSNDYYNEMYTRSMLPVFEKRKQLIGKGKFFQTIENWEGNHKGRVLDIGAGIGEVTDVFKEEGWLSHAIEMNSVAIEWLKGRNHEEVFHGTLDEYETNLKFDIIMAWGVVEHVLDPNGFLQKVRDLILPNGLFVSEVPHGESFLIDMSRKIGMDPKRILMGEQHIVLYSTEAYINLHERNGFELVHLQTNGLDVSTTFKELGLKIENDLISSMQECVDEKLYGDLLRGFWRKA